MKENKMKMKKKKLKICQGKFDVVGMELNT